MLNFKNSRRPKNISPQSFNTLWLEVKVGTNKVSQQWSSKLLGVQINKWFRNLGRSNKWERRSTISPQSETLSSSKIEKPSQLRKIGQDSWQFVDIQSEIWTTVVWAGTNQWWRHQDQRFREFAKGSKQYVENFGECQGQRLC